MTETEAFDYVKARVEPFRDPLLFDADILAAVQQNQIAGGSCYDLENAQGDLWRLKMAKATDYIDAQIEGRDYKADQVFKHCQEMYALVMRRVNTTVGGPGDGDEFRIVANWNNPYC